MKRFILFTLILSLIISITPNPVASATNYNYAPKEKKEVNNKVDTNSNNKIFDAEDVMALEKYIKVFNGKFSFNKEEAYSDGVDLTLIEGQITFLNQLNSEIEAGILKVEDDLSIIRLKDKEQVSPDMQTLACKGKTTKSKDYWWGFTQKLNSCDTNKFAADLGSAGTIAGGGALLLTWFGFWPALPAGLGSAYFHLMGSRASANNNGKGINMKIWWTLAYKFSPQ
ncbi:surface antigen [Bacillus stratosphericus LAMA 585]|nr:surface antigen [Bacillus stratosphericus LAMA 585]